MVQISSTAFFSATNLEQVPLLYPLNITVLMKSCSPTQLLSLHGKGHEEGSNAGAQLRLPSSLASLCAAESARLYIYITSCIYYEKCIPSLTCYTAI